MSRTLEDLNQLSLEELYRTLTSNTTVERLLELMRLEDLSEGHESGDITAIASDLAWGGSERVVTREIRSRSHGVVSGLRVVPALLKVFECEVDYECRVSDGDRLTTDETIVRLRADHAELHVIERPLLNLLSRLSGVSTRTSAFVAAVRDAEPDRRVDVLDTRKTTPGLRALEKYAVRCGGGACHRIGLYDAVLVKDNHLAGLATEHFADHVGTLARHAREARALKFVEVEVDTLAQFDALLGLPTGLIDVVMLDNMPIASLIQASAMRDERAPALLLEASGGVRLDTIGAIARTGVDRISVGSLTHGATWLDLGMDSVD